MNIKGPSFNLVKGFEASAETTFDIHLAHGEVEVFKKDFPERAKAQALKVALDYRGDVRELNLGRFSLSLGARAWGRYPQFVPAGVASEQQISWIASSHSSAASKALFIESCIRMNNSGPRHLRENKLIVRTDSN